MMYFNREVSAISDPTFVTLTYQVQYNGNDLAFLEMTKDLSYAQKSMLRLGIPLILGSIFLTISIGLLLWYAMRKLALIPMEREISIREHAERKFRLLLESTPDALIYADQDGKILMVNAQTESLFGYNRSKLEGDKIETLMPERFRSKHLMFRDKFISNPAARPMGMNMELYGLTKKGIEFPADISLSPIETEEGLFILSAIRDITERKNAEMKLKRSYDFQSAISSILNSSLESVPLEKQLHRILDTILTIPDLSLESMGCIYLTDDDSESLIMTAQHGLPEAIKSNCSKVLFSQCLCGEAAQSQKIIFADCTDTRHKDHLDYGNDYPHSHYCVPIISGDKTLGVINLVIKKEHKQSEDEEHMLISVANTIAGIIEHSRTDLERLKLQEQLAINDKMSALGRFTANVAHDIRTPLTLIGGFARRIRKNIPKKSKDNEHLNIIIDEVKRLENILKNVLTYSRNVALQLDEHDLNKIILDSLNAYQDRLSDTSILIQNKLGDIPSVMIDKDQIIEVINNILSNAMDSMSEGGTLTVSTNKELAHEGSYIVMKISDTGEGMSEEQLKMIFEPFYSTKIIGHGTGLGLPISKKIMEDHSGFIAVNSKKGVGSAFKLFFPLNSHHDSKK
jgi:PAS domain S-box-containing protein